MYCLIDKHSAAFGFFLTPPFSRRIIRLVAMPQHVAESEIDFFVLKIPFDKLTGLIISVLQAYAEHRLGLIFRVDNPRDVFFPYAQRFFA